MITILKKIISAFKRYVRQKIIIIKMYLKTAVDAVAIGSHEKCSGGIPIVSTEFSIKRESRAYPLVSRPKKST